MIDNEQLKITSARVISTKRESMASDNSVELPDAIDSSLPTSFGPEMFKSEPEQQPDVELEEKVHDESIVQEKELEVETSEASTSHKKHSHHHHSKAKKKKDKKKKHKHKHKHHKHDHKKKAKEETLSSASSASNSPAQN